MASTLNQLIPRWAVPQFYKDCAEHYSILKDRFKFTDVSNLNEPDFRDKLYYSGSSSLIVLVGHASTTIVQFKERHLSTRRYHCTHITDSSKTIHYSSILFGATKGIRKYYHTTYICTDVLGGKNINKDKGRAYSHELAAQLKAKREANNLLIIQRLRKFLLASIRRTDLVERTKRMALERFNAGDYEFVATACSWLKRVEADDYLDNLLTMAFVDNRWRRYLSSYVAEIANLLDSIHGMQHNNETRRKLIKDAVALFRKSYKEEIFGKMMAKLAN